MRHYPGVPRDSKKKKKNLLAKAGVERADEKVLSELAALADRVGFESNEIQALKQRLSDREIECTHFSVPFPITFLPKLPKPHPNPDRFLPLPVYYIIDCREAYWLGQRHQRQYHAHHLPVPEQCRCW